MSNPNLELLNKVIAEEAVMGFVTFDTQTKSCVYANKMGRHLLEMSEVTELEKIKMEALFPEEVVGKFRKLDEELLSHEGFYQDIYIKKTNGQLFIAHLGVKNVEMNGQPHILLMMQDMTIQKKLQRDLMMKQEEITSAYEELLEQNKQLKELDLAKNRFIALTTHELRTPLSAMVASAELLTMKLYDNDEQRDEFTQMIYDEGQHLLALVNDILDFSKIQAGKMDYFISEQDIVSLVEEEVDVLENFAETSKVQLEFKKPESELSCYFDGVRLKQVVANIINNAIKYNNDDGHVKVWLEHDEDMCTLYVEDNGNGIPEEQQAQVFNEFDTLGKVANHSKGTGLGMPISRRLIEGMGGKIDFESKVGQGTKFWITVPRIKVVDEEHYRTRSEDLDDLAS